MSTPRIVDALNCIDDDLVSGAVTYTRGKKRSFLTKFSAIAACLCCTAFVVFSVTNSSETVDTPELGEISAFTQDQLSKRLIGLMQEEIYHSWGEPDEVFSDSLCDIWYLDSDGKERVILYYNDNRCVAEIVFVRER